MIIIPLIIVASTFVAINVMYKRTNHFNNQFVDVCKFWRSSPHQKDLQVVNLGSNHPKFGFDYSGLDIKGENWAVGPQTLVYDFAILRNNVDRLVPGATVIIPICLLKMFLFRQKPRSVHQKYYTFLPKEDIVGYSAWEKFRNIIFPVIDYHRWRFILKDVKKDTRLELTSNSMTTVEQLDKDANMWVNIWNKEFDITLPDPTLSEENQREIKSNIRVLREMLEYCTTKGLKPILAILPVTEHLSSKFTDSFIENHIIKYLNEANTVNAPLLNF